MTYGATLADWLHFDRVLGIGGDLLPVVSNPNAKISQTSKLKCLGKTPSVYNPEKHVVGIADWTRHQTSDQEITRWANCNDLGICVQTRNIRAIDIDVSDYEIVQHITAAISIELGMQLPIRRRVNSSKCLLAFRMDGDLAKQIFHVDGGMIEILGNGQQFVAIGTHPSGSKYEWLGGLPTEIPEITREQFEHLLISLEIQFAKEPIREFSSTSRKKGENFNADDPVVDFLETNGLVRGQQRDGSITIECPWNGEHSGGEIGDGSTVWFRAGTNGHPRGHFKCLHAHCAGRHDAQFFEAIGYVEDFSEDFDFLDTPSDVAEVIGTSNLSQIAQSKRIKASPFEWVNPEDIPRRQWLYGRHLIRKFLSATVSPGGVGKSSLELADAVAMASGQSLLGAATTGALRVWYWNGEDPKEEIIRRVAAICKHYGISSSDLSNRLFIDSGRDMEIIIANELKDGAKIAEPIVNSVIQTIRENHIDVLIVDPFVSAHRVSENDNNSIDRVAKTFSRIAELTNCAISLVHHSRKTGGAQVTAEDARGASALISAARSVRVLNPMTADEASKAGISGNPRIYFSVENGKANLAPPVDARLWYKLQSVALGNNDGLIDGDYVGVVIPWEWQAASNTVSLGSLRDIQDAIAGGNYRSSDKSSAWVGRVVADVLDLDLEKDADKKRVRSLLKDWLKGGYLREEMAKDGRREMRPFIRVGVLVEAEENLDAE